MSESLSWEEKKRRAQNPSESKLVKEPERQIRKYGKIQEYGAGDVLYSEEPHLSETSHHAPRKQAKKSRKKYIPARHRDREDDPDED